MKHALPLLFLAACGTPGADPDAPDAALTDTIEAMTWLNPGELIEGQMHGGPSDRAVIHVEAPTTELDWNIHGHENDETQTIYEELNVSSADYTFTPPSETDWWLLLRNSGPDDMEITVRVDLYGGMTWEWI